MKCLFYLSIPAIVDNRGELQSTRHTKHVATL